MNVNKPGNIVEYVMVVAESRIDEIFNGYWSMDKINIIQRVAKPPSPFVHTETLDTLVVQGTLANSMTPASHSFIMEISNLANPEEVGRFRMRLAVICPYRKTIPVKTSGPDGTRWYAVSLLT